MPASWNTNAAGGGTAASNFTTNNDIFIIPSGRAGVFSTNGNITFASGVTLQVDGTFTIDSKTSLIINGTIIFTNTSTTQVTLTAGPGSNSSSIAINGTAKTNNTNGISGSNCSLPATASQKTVTLSTTANYEFNGANQSTTGLPSTVNDLIFSGSGTKTISSAINTVSGNFTTAGTASVTAINNMTINGNVILGTGTTFNGSTFSHTVKGNWTNLGTYTAATSTVTFSGTSAQTFSGATTFNNLQLNNNSGFSILSDVTVSQNLSLNAGIVATGANTLIVGSSNVTRGSGWVNGNLQENVSGTGTYNFYVGSGTSYRPATIVFTSVTTNGPLKVSQLAGPHPQILSAGVSPYINPYWTLTSVGVAGTYTATFTFLSTDASAAGIDTPSSMIANKYIASSWNTLTAGSNTATTNTVTGVTTFGDFAIGLSTGIPQVTTQPANVTICSTTTTTSFTAASTSKPTPTVKWQRSSDGGASWIDITANLDAGVTYSGFNTNTLTLTGTTTLAGQNSYKYRPIYTNLNGSSSNAVAATLTVNTAPSATINYPGSPYGSTVSTPQPVNLTGTTGGTFSKTAGPGTLTLNSSTGEVTPNTSTPGTYTVTYTIAAAGGCPQFQTNATVTITLAPTVTISYNNNPFCKSVTTPQPVTFSNGQGSWTGGMFSPVAGLSINQSNGEITPSTSTAGTYTVTYNIPASAPYPPSTATTQVTITAVPTAAISYSSSSFCTGDATANNPTITGTGAYMGGAFTSNPAGLSIDGTTGAITPSLSTGTTGGTVYTVTYTVPASGGCSIVTTSTNITIVKKAAGSIAYSQPSFCQSFTTPQPVTLVTNSASPATYSSSPAGLSLNASTGDITPSASTPGDYTVYYTFNNSSCGTIQYSTTVSIVVSPTANISYSASAYCQSGGAQSVALTGTGNYTGGVYTSSPGGG